MRNRLSAIIGVLAFVLCGSFFFSTPQEAQITIPITVGNTSDIVVAGACTQTGNPANCSLRGAIEQANVGSSNSIIRFQIPGCPGGVCTISLTQALPDIIFPLSIVGPGADKLTVRHARGTGNPALRIFSVTTAGTVSISGITIADAFSNGNGAGIRNLTGTLNVSNCTISNNIANNGYGGGIYNEGGTVNVTNSTISSNNAVPTTTGGGIFNGDGGTLTVTNSNVSHNFAETGAGIYNGSGVGTSHANIINSTFYDNGSESRGGAIFNDAGAELVVTNSTFSRNKINPVNGVNGGGISNIGSAYLKSSIIALNTGPTGPDVNGTFLSFGFNLVGKSDGSTIVGGSDLLGTIAAPLNPMFHPAELQNNGGPTMTMALLPSSPAIDRGTSFGLGGTLTSDQRGAAFRRTFDSSSVPNPGGGDGTDIGAFELQGKSTADFDGDFKTDIGIFRPTDGTWWINRSSNSVTTVAQFGAGSDKMAPADFTGDGKTDIAVWRPSNGNWFILRSEDFSFYGIPFGTAGDIPAPADFDGDGKADIVVFRQSNGVWFIQQSGGGTRIEQFGINGDVPVAGDYDGDGKADKAIFRPSNGQWWLARSIAGVVAVTFGVASDKPTPGDFTGDGKADVALWRPSNGNWFVLRSEDFSFFAFPFGTVGDIPAPGDYDGDGKFDATVFRPSDATWYSQQTTAGIVIRQFGANGDRPVANAFVP